MVYQKMIYDIVWVKSNYKKKISCDDCRINTLAWKKFVNQKNGLELNLLKDLNNILV